MSYKYFNNYTCEYYPCHKIDNINCLFCFCPLYNFKCEGDFIIINGIKDCTKCNYPHKEDNYDNIIIFLNRKNE